MVFTAKTVTVWNPPQPDDALRALANERAELLATQGLTDGIPFQYNLLSGQVEVTRKWTTVDAADEWVTFITTYGPQSVEVILL